jgi:hypothetical protein
MSETFCQQPTLDGFFFCESCIKRSISDTQQYQTQFTSATYNSSHQTLSSTIPENGKCNYRMARGEFKGWYCSKPTYLDLSYCKSCITKVAKFNFEAEGSEGYNNLVLCVNNKLCIHVL